MTRTAALILAAAILLASVPGWYWMIAHLRHEEGVASRLPWICPQPPKDASYAINREFAMCVELVRAGRWTR